MNTNNRSPKKHDVTDAVSTNWNSRLDQCIETAGLTREAFVKAFKKRYGTGNRTDAYRWFNVGMTYKGAKIGLPTYDTMKHIADFFEVTVGYLTGETDYKSFDMGHACTFLGITEEAGVAIKSITDGKVSSKHLNRFMKSENTAALCYLLTAPHFNDFIGGLCSLARNLDRQQNRNHYLEKALASISPELKNAAWELRDYDFSLHNEDAPELTLDLIDAIFNLRSAEALEVDELETRETHVKLSKYILLEHHFKLLDEVVCADKLSALVGEQNRRLSLE